MPFPASYLSPNQPLYTIDSIDVARTDTKCVTDAKGRFKSSLSEEERLAIINLYTMRKELDFTIASIAQASSVSRSTVHRIVARDKQEKAEAKLQNQLARRKKVSWA